MSNDFKRLLSWVGAAVITVLLVGVYLEQWWTALGFFLLVGLALNAVLGGSRIEDAWGKFETAIVVGAAVSCFGCFRRRRRSFSRGLRTGARCVAKPPR